MPIFKNELLGGLPPETNKLQAYLGSIEPLPISSPGPAPGLVAFGQPQGPEENMTMDRLSKIRGGMASGFGSPLNSASNKELQDNARYPLYQRELNLENIYGNAQSWYSALGNGIAKAGVRALGTFAESFTNIPNVIDAIDKGDFSQLAGDPDGFEGSVDNWVNNMENSLPNYYTNKEKDSPWLAAIPLMPGSANFWGDKIIKNLGFTAGAIAGAVVQDLAIGAITGGIGEVPLIAGQIGRISLAMNKLFSTMNKGEDILSFATRLGISESKLLSMHSAYAAAKLTKLGNGVKYATTLLGSAMTESGVEAREGYRSVKEALIEQYKFDNLGQNPSGQDLTEIEQYASDAMNTRFGINMAILTVSNAIMFDNLFKSLGTAEKGLVSGNRILTKEIGNLGKVGLKEGSLDVFEKKAVTGLGNKVWEFAKPKLPTIFSEGLYEEGGQYAAESGTYDYYTRKYKNLNNPSNKKSWNTVDETINSTMKGFEEQFGSEEGLQNMFIGAISALFMTGGQNIIDKKRGVGKDARLQKSLEVLNRNLLTGIFKNKYEDSVTSVAIANDMEKAASSGDMFKYRNLQNEMLFNMVNTRSKAGMHDVTIDQLEMLKDLSEEEFSKQFGIDFTKENQQTVVGYVDALIERANKMDADIKQINEIYTNPYTFKEKPETPEDIEERDMHIVFESWKTEVAAAKSAKHYLDIRNEEISNKVMSKFPGLNNTTLMAVTSKKGLNAFSEEYAEQASILEESINELTTARERTKIREEVKLLQGLSSKANLMANRIDLDGGINSQYLEDILSYENNNRSALSKKRISSEDVVELRKDGDSLNRGEFITEQLGKKLVALTSKEGMMKYIAQEEDIKNQVVPEEIEGINYINDKKKSVPLELGREYSVNKTKEVSFKQVGPKRFEIELPSGEKIYTSTEAQAKAEVVSANRKLSSLNKVKVLGLNTNGTITVEDSNGNVFDVQPETLKGYARVATMQEKLLKKTEVLEKIQKGIETKSGVIASIPVTEELPFFGEGKIKPTEILFISSTTGSVDFAEQKGQTIAPHITRSFTFLENVENFENREDVKAILVNSRNETSLGLDGLTLLSLPSAKIEEEKANVTGGFMAQVYVVENGGKKYFISETGETLNEVGTQADLSKVVFQTMPTTETVWPSNGKPRYREGEKEQAEHEAARYEAFRKNYYEGDEVLTLPFIVSRGIANEGPKDYRGHASTVFIEESKISSQQGLIQIATNDSVVYQGQTLKVPSGVPMILYKDKLQYLNNRTFNKKEVETIYAVIEAFSKELIERAEKAKGGTISKISDYSAFLQNILYWKSKIKADDVTSENQIFVDLKQMTINLGKESYPIDKISSLKKEITEQLSKIYSSVNNHTLTKEFDKPFMEMVLKGGQLASVEWENYQTYLLASKNPDGSNRSVDDTPLTTNILPPTESVPYSFKQKYTTLEGVELPEIAKAPTVAKTPVKVPENAKVVGGIVLDGVTQNVSKALSSKGAIKFTAYLDENGKPKVSISDDSLSLARVVEVSEDAGIMKVIVENLRGVFEFDDATPAHDLVIAFLELAERTRLNKALASESKPTVTATSIEENNNWAIGDSITQADIVPDDFSQEILDIDKKDIKSMTIVKLNKVTDDTIDVDIEIVIGKNKSILNVILNPKKAFVNPAQTSKKDDSIEKIEDLIRTMIREKKSLIDFTVEEQALISSNKISLERREEIRLEEESRPNTPPTKPKNFKGNNRGGIVFRKYGKKDSEKRMTEEDITIFREWAVQNVPNIPFEILEKIITIHNGEKAWGVFENGVVKFVRGGLKGTEYHEVFEAIYNAMLSNEEKQALLDEFKGNIGFFIDRVSNKKIAYDEATDEQAKERIADDFAKYRLGKLSIRNFSDLLQRFYRAILNFANYFRKASLKQELFKAIDNGRFKNEKLKPFMNSAYAAVAGLTDKQTHEFIQDMTALAGAIIVTNKEELFSPKGLTGQEVFDKIEEIYSNPEESIDGFTKRETLGDIAWLDLVQRTKDSLRVLKINFDDEDIVTINDEGANKNEYADNPFTLDARKSSTWPIKFIMATLLRTESSTNKGLSIELPPYKTSDVGGGLLLNFGRSFATVLDKLSNSSTPSLAVEKLIELATDDPNYVRLLTRLGGKIQKNENGKTIAHIPYADFNVHDWRLFIQFIQTFTRQHPNAIVQFKNYGEVYSASINEYTAARETVNKWTDRIKLLAEDNDRLVYYDKVNKKYKTRPLQSDIFQSGENSFIVSTPYNVKKTFTTEKEAVLYAKQNSISIRSLANSIKFLNDIGITYTMDAVNKLSKTDKDKFMQAVSAIFKHLNDKTEIMTLTGRTLDIKGPLDILSTLFVKATNPNKENTHYGVDGKRRGDYSESNATSVLEDDFNEAGTLENLLLVRPELNDIFSQGSLILKQGGEFIDKNGKIKRSIKVEYIQGTKDITDNIDITTSNLNIGDRFTQEINQNLNGKYYAIIPADSSTEWMMNFGHFYTYKQLVSEKQRWNTILSAFSGYLMDDVRLALDFENREYIKNVKNNGAKDLRFFKDILDGTQMLEDINRMIRDSAPYSEIEDYVNDNQMVLQGIIKDLVRNMSKKTEQTLKNNNKILRTGEEAEFFYYKDIDSIFTKANDIDKNNLSQEQLDSILDFATINQVIANIEMHKLLFGDPYQFKIKDGILDETKRIKSFLSPRKKMFDTPEFNTFLNQHYNKVGKVVLTEKDPGHHTYKPYANVVTLTDVEVAGSLSNTIDAYSRNNETDGFSWMMDATYKEVQEKNGQWHDDAEKWHQWQMAYTRKNVPGYVYTDKALGIHDTKLLETRPPKYTLKVLKPIVSGTAYNTDFIKLNLHKFAQMPIYYSMVKGTTMEALYLKMFNEKIDYAIVDSGAKVGITTSYNIYNADGTFNNEEYTNIERVSWKSYGIQVETESENDKYQTRGSQLTKMASMNLFSNGVAVSEEAEKEYRENTDLLDRMHENAYNILLQKLGVRDTGFGFEMFDGTSLSETLMTEMLRREASDNLKDALKLDANKQFKIPFEAAPSYINIRDIVYSMVSKSLIKPKLSGGAHVQVPSTMFEDATKGRSLRYKKDKIWNKITREEYNALSAKEKRKVALTDDTLKFYEDEDGKRYIEVMIPHWFKKLFKEGTSENEVMNEINKSPELMNILKGIGFRIPSQALSSVEIFVVKGFLPSYMGSTVVVPSEITTKAGSDFDIDKLNMYLKSLYRDSTGRLRIIKLLENEQTTKAHYAREFDKILENKKISKANSLKYLQEKEISEQIELGSIYEMQEESENPGSTSLTAFLEMLFDGDASTEIKKVIDKLNDVQHQAYLKEKFISGMYTKALENSYYSSLERLIGIKENFQQLITPVDDGGYEAMSIKLDKLRNIDEGSVKNKLIDKNYLTNLRAQFILAKRWIGIAAVNITNLSIRQKSAVYFDRNRIASLTEYEKEYLGNGEIQIPHNKVNIDGVEYASISAVKTQDNTDNISNRLSGFATSTVDVAKNPYILKVYSSDLLVSPAMFLESIGAGEKGIIFLNQPIIQQYVKMMDSKNATNIFNKDNVSSIMGMFPESNDFNFEDKIDLDKLESNISDYSGEQGVFKESSKENNNQQRLILLEFLKYAKLGRNMFSLSQATNYDTTTFRNGEELMRKQIQTESASEKNLFSSVDNILGTTFIGTQERFISQSIEALNSIFKLDTPALKSISDEIIRPYAENMFTSRDVYAKIVQDVKIGLLDYILQTGKNLDSRRVEELLVNVETSIAMRLEKAKLKYIDLQILQDLEVVSSKRHDGFKSIKLNADTKEAYDENYYTGLMRELRDTNSETNAIYNDLINVAIIQGTKRSGISIKNIIPIEDYASVVTPIIEQATSGVINEIFTKGMFHRNHFTQDDLVPLFQPKFWGANRDEMGNMIPSGFLEDGFTEVYTYVSPQFPNIPALGYKSTDRQILLMSEKFNSKYINNDFIKVSRTVRVENVDKETGDKSLAFIDLKTGNNIPFARVLANREAGDYSLFTQYGYAKVKLPDGTPLTTEDEKGNVQHVYKLVNLYGEGVLGKEYYNSFEESKADNGTFKVQRELDDNLLIEYYGDLATTATVKKESDRLITRLGENSFVPRSAIKANRDILYLFGDNNIRAGLGGTAKEMRGEPNSVGISTKRLPSNEDNAFMTDDHLEMNKQIISGDINKAIEEWNTGNYRKLVIPAIGEDRADLLNRAPETYKFLQEELERLQKHIVSAQLDNKEEKIDSEERIIKLPTRELNDIPVFSDRGVNVMRKPGHYHFGNPYTGTFNKAGLITIFDSNGNYNTTEARNNASEAYKQWLLGNKDTDLNQSQRRYILAQINKGLLDDAKLLYMSDRSGYITHAQKLIEVVNELRDLEDKSISLPENNNDNDKVSEKPVKNKKITKADIDWAVGQINTGILNYAGGPSQRIQISDMTRAQIMKAAKDIQSKKFNTVPAKLVIEALRDARPKGYYDYLIGLGGNTNKIQVPIESGKTDPNQPTLFEQDLTDDWLNEDNNEEDCEVPF